MKCAASQFARVDKADLLRFRRGTCDCEALVADRAAIKRKYPGFVVDRATLDDIMVFTVKGEKP